MRRSLVFLCLGLVLAPAILSAQDAGAGSTAWTFRTRAIMTGVSDSSEPAGYKVYSALGMEADLTRGLSRRFELAWSLGTQSREVELRGAGGKMNLGSIEVLPVSMLLQFHPRREGRFHPYVGAGVHFTVFWEKSGLLDSSDLTPEVGPTLEAGFDYDISPRMVFNVDFRVARLETDLETDGNTIASLALHPSTLGVGIGFRF